MPQGTLCVLYLLPHLPVGFRSRLTIEQNAVMGYPWYVLYYHVWVDYTSYFSGDLEAGAISDVANDATAYAQRDSLVRY